MPQFQRKLAAHLECAPGAVQFIAVVARQSLQHRWELVFARIDVAREEDLPRISEVDARLARSFVLRMGTAEFVKWLDAAVTDRAVRLNADVEVATDAFAKLCQATRGYSPEKSYAAGWPFLLITGPSLPYARPIGRLIERESHRVYPDIEEFVSQASGLPRTVRAGAGSTGGPTNSINVIVWDYAARIEEVSSTDNTVTVRLGGEHLDRLQVVVEREGTGEPRWAESIAMPARTAATALLSEAPLHCVRVQVVAEDGPPIDEWYVWPTPLPQDVKEDSACLLDEANRLLQVSRDAATEAEHCVMAPLPFELAASSGDVGGSPVGSPDSARSDFAPSDVDIGGIGQDAVRQWARQAGITPNPVETDRGGWDLLLELPQVRREGLSFDLIPGEVSCKVQVKTTTTTDTSASIKLSNWQRMVTDTSPWFVVAVVLGANHVPVEAYVVHVDEEWTARVLERLRELEESDDPRKRKLAVSWTEEHKLSGLHGRYLHDELRKYIGDDPWVYANRKQRWLKELGYEGRHGLARITTPSMPVDELNKTIVDFVVGLTPRLPIQKLEVERTRFGITKIEQTMSDGGQFAELSDLPSVGTTLVRFSRPDGSGAVEITCSTHPSSAVASFVPDHFHKVRLVSDLVSVVLSMPHDGQMAVQLTINLPSPGMLHPLEVLAQTSAVAELMRIAADEPIRWEVRTNGDGFSRDDFQPNEELPSSVVSFYRVVHRACLIAQHFGLPEKTKVDAQAIVAAHEAIGLLSDAVGPSVKPARFSFDAKLAEPPVAALAGLLMCPAVKFGEHVVGACVALIGIPNFQVRAPGLVRIDVPDAKVRVVEHWTVPATRWCDALGSEMVTKSRKALEGEGIALIVAVGEQVDLEANGE